ncbi:MAG: hypothetical protein EAZ89_19590, partial [Bacteroidetes bacterium]
MSLRPVFQRIGQKHIDSLEIEAVLDLAESSKGGGVWLASAGGIHLLIPAHFVSPPGLPESGPWANIEDQDGSRYVTIGEVYHILREGQQYRVETFPTGNWRSSTSMEKDNYGRLWIADFDGRVMHTDLNTRKSGIMDFRNQGGTIFYMKRDSKGFIWACQAPEDKPLVGITRINPADLSSRHFGKEEGLETRVIDLKEREDASIIFGCVGAESYLYRYDPVSEQFTNISLRLPFTPASVFEVHNIETQGRDTIWLATTDGLLCYNGKSITRTQTGWPLTEEIRSVTKGPDGALWLGSKKDGIGWLKNEEFVQFGISSGLPTDELDYATIFTDQKGYVWIGTAAGLVVSSEPYPTPPPTMRPHWQIAGYPENTADGKLPEFPYQSSIVSSFFAYTFTQEPTLYQTRIVEKSPEWSQPVESPSWDTGPLAAGIYTLEVCVRHGTGYAWS